MGDDRVQQDAPVLGQCGVHLPEELGVGLEAEVFERADHEDAVDLAVEFLPGLEPNLFGAITGQAREKLLDVFVLVLADGQSDDVDVVLLGGSGQCGAPSAADVQNCHPGLEVQFAQHKVNLRHLGLLEGVVVLLEVRARVGQRGVEEQAEKIVGQVVVGLDVLVRLLQVAQDSLLNSFEG